MKKSSEEFRQLQRERIMNNKPWMKSTGPRSRHGKNTSKMNALKVPSWINDINNAHKAFMHNQKEIRVQLRTIII